MTTPERRRDVRVRPTLELPARAVLLGDGIVHEAVNILDISVGGMRLVLEPSLAKRAQGDKIVMQLNLPDEYGDLPVAVLVRWKSGAATGVQFIDLEPKSASTLGKYVAELLERGAL